MNSLSATLSIGLRGVARGTTDSPTAIFPLRAQTLGVLTLTSTGTGGSKGTQGYGPRVRTINPAASENIDWLSFVNTAQEAGSSFASVIRLFYLLHSPASAAATVTVGNVGVGAWTPFNWPAATTLQFKPGEGVAFFAPTVAGLAVDATHHLLKVLNDDAAQIATYECGSFGQ